MDYGEERKSGRGLFEDQEGEGQSSGRRRVCWERGGVSFTWALGLGKGDIGRASSESQ